MFPQRDKYKDVCVSEWVMSLAVINATSYLKLACKVKLNRLLAEFLKFSGDVINLNVLHEFLSLKSEFWMKTGGLPQESLLSIDPPLTWRTATHRLKPFPEHVNTHRQG